MKSPQKVKVKVRVKVKGEEKMPDAHRGRG